MPETPLITHPLASLLKSIMQLGLGRSQEGSSGEAGETNDVMKAIQARSRRIAIERGDINTASGEKEGEKSC